MEPDHGSFMEDFQFQVMGMQKTLAKLKIIIFEIKDRNRMLVDADDNELTNTHEIQVILSTRVSARL